MKLNKITITGADENIKPSELVALSKRFPFVEWGILFSKQRQGNEPRYPSIDWIKKIMCKKKLKLAAHLCGGYAKSVIIGDYNPLMEIHNILSSKNMESIQLNFKSTNVETDIDKFMFLTNNMFLHKNIIFQLRNDESDDFAFDVNERKMKNNECGISGLYDKSGGTGKVIDHYPVFDKKLIATLGYAGGINPDNIESVLKNIQNAAITDQSTWIDMESGVRTDDKFDLEKVEVCLKIAVKYINK